MSDPVFTEFYAPLLKGTRYRKLQQNDNITRQQILERMYRRTLGELCVNRFIWHGLPETVDPRFVEMTLYHFGVAVFYEDLEVGAQLVVKGSPAGKHNLYDNPVKFKTFGSNYRGETLRNWSSKMMKKQADDCVPIWANYFRLPDLDIVTTYAYRLAEIDRSIEINVRNTRRSRMVVASENAKHSATAINREIDSGSAVVFVRQNPTEMFGNFDLGVHPDQVEKLHIVKTRIMGEVLSMLGIKTANQDKKERLVEAEVTANDDQIDNHKFVALNARQQAAELINARYGTNISVEYRSDVENRAQQIFTSILDADTQPGSEEQPNE